MAEDHVTKVCTTCHVAKPLGAFWVAVRESGGRRTRCAECEARHRRERKAARRSRRPLDTAASAIAFRDLSALGFPGYRVGDDGSVWSCWERHGIPGMRGSWFRIGNRWRPLKLMAHKNGGQMYACLTVETNGNRVRKHCFVHRLVLLAFMGPCPTGMEGCHDPDPNPRNNRLSNLRWDTSKANKADAERHGRRAKGARNGKAKLNDDAVRAIRADLATGMRKATVGRKHGISRSTVSCIAHKQTWRHVV